MYPELEHPVRLPLVARTGTLCVPGCIRIAGEVAAVGRAVHIEMFHAGATRGL